MTTQVWGARRLLAGAMAGLAVAGALLVPGQALAEQPASVAALPGPDGDLIEAKYAALGGPSGVLGAAMGSKTCSGLSACWQDFENGIVYWSAFVPSAAYAFTDPEIFDAWPSGFGAVPVPGGIGEPTSDTFCGLPDEGCGQHFQNGSIYVSAATAAVRVDPDIRTGWAAEGWERGPVGYPTTDTFCGLPGGGCGQHFQRGSVYWSPSTGSRTVRGPIRDRWAGQGWENGSLGYPTSSTFCGLRDGGCGQHFQGGSVYWSPSSGARVLAPEVIGRWAGQGWENGALGYPTSEPFFGDRIRGQHFQGGSIYSTWNGTFTVLGSIRDAWGAQGWERGTLGRPTSDTFCGLRDGACGQHFQGGSVYATRAGTFLVTGSQLAAWGRQGWENGPLGYPTSSTFCGLRDNGCGQHFQGGSLYSGGAPLGWRSPNAYAVTGALRDAWAARGWENGNLGYPRDNAYQAPGGLTQLFQGGYLQLRNGRVY
ncbi:hypothetical protein DQ244_08150 [Blastococcus sp. TBT05-19]|uniref:hypothetical protein n=1 Tax=Blastococcus sp. TBT05-19 TaxID=2250581 RepID=UPI000DE9A3F4|nr:hypothetical protein [Blastococcus sp. TBT05-19]RBY92251.1 hypothetical protein DQ244_08150 [Blastococcus sp. TBT05-19]